MALEHNVVSWFKRLSFITFTVLCLLFATGRHASAQVDEGAITGTILDSTGAAVPGASVTLLNNEQGLSLETKSSSTGAYTFSPVRIGTYQVTATAPGFTTTTQKNLVVNVGSQVEANVTLGTGASSTTVTVTEAPPQLQTEESSVGQVMTERSVNNLPLNGRNFTFLAQLGAGVNVAQADTRGNSASGAFSANGLRPAQNNYLLDGIDNNSNAVDFLNGTNFVILPPVDAISEFNVQTTDFSAQLGRAAGAVLNATIKSGSNSLHGTVWEFFRNDKLDAADYFETAGKGELRFNQFGASVGGPVIKNKIFFFGDYEGFRRVQGNTASGVSVPTVAERTSGFTNLSDVISGQGGLNAANDRTDALGRKIPFGTIMDPATTRATTAGQIDPTTGIVAAQTGYARDPIGTNAGNCASGYNGTKSFDGCNLNQIPGARLNNANSQAAIKLLNLYPQPTNGSLSGNFTASPALFEHRNAFDVRVDFNPSEKDQVFFRFSYVDDPQFIPGPFGGVADGGAFQQGIQTAKSDQAVLGYTHIFTPNLVNVIHGGFNHLHSTRFGPEGSVTGIPAQYGIAGVPQGNENGGLPALVISGLSELGSNDFLPSDEVSQTLQITDDFTKIYAKNSFKMGVEYQNIHFNTLQPAYSRGEFDFNGNYAGVPGLSGDNTGRAQFLLTPTASSVGGPDGIGGANELHASNISKTYDQRSYLALYFQDDLKVNSQLTLNLGLRYDYFSPIAETNGGQANFVQSGPPNGTPTFLYPASGKAIRALSPSFIALAAQDGIAIEATDKYGKGLVQTQKNNFAPRAGFAYQIDPKFVVRGGVGLFFNAFENQGYGPNIGENYPFIYNFDFKGNGSDSAPFSSGPNPYNASCATAGVGGSVPITAGLSCVQFSPTVVNAAGLGLQGLQFNSKTPRTFSSNFSMQYALTHTMSAQVAYVLTDASDLQVGTGNNTVTQLVPANTALTRNNALPDTPTNHNYVPFQDFGQGGSYQRTLGSSIYNGLQAKVEQTLSNGLNFLATYTYSKTLTDAPDLLNGGSVSGYRAANVPGFGPRFDWGLASSDIRNVVHLSGGYELPVGKNKKFLGSSGGVVDKTLGGWSLNYIVTLQGGQPLGFGCPTGTTSGTNCNTFLVPGQSPKLGIHKDINEQVSWIGNPKAFQQPCQLGFNAAGVAVPIPDSPAGCSQLTGAGALGSGPSIISGPGFHRFDLSAFKTVNFNERFRMEFRAEFFNILNHPNFNAPNFGGNGVTSISNSGNFNSSAFGEIGSTRDAPFDPRQIQFALKLYY